MTTEEIIGKIIAQYGPTAGILLLAGGVFWRDFLKPKLENSLKAEAKKQENEAKKEDNELDVESSMQRLLIGMGTKLIDELPRLREAMSNLTLHILQITQGQQEHAAQLTELRSKTENHGQELKLYSHHFEKIYNKQIEQSETHADSQAEIINKLDSILSKIDK